MLMNHWPDAKKFAVGLAQYCPHGKVGDKLWVRETHKLGSPCVLGGACETEVNKPWMGMHPDGKEACVYRADKSWGDGFGPWKPSIFMPRWASRITLEITRVRVERLKDISEEDAIAEGAVKVESDGTYTDAHCNFIPYCGRDAAMAFAELWESINGDGSWDANPWVWVIEFRRVEQ